MKHSDSDKENLAERLNLKDANIDSLGNLLDHLIEGKAGFTTSSNLDDLKEKFEQIKKLKSNNSSQEE